MKRMIIALIAMLFVMPMYLSADIIYTWVDEEGVKRFSNEPPPETVKSFERIDTGRGSSTPGPSTEQRREEFDRMVDQAANEARQLENERIKRQKRAALLEKRKAARERRAQNAAKRAALEKKIAEIRARAVSPTYTTGMKNAQIEKIQQQIDQIKD